jgi:hypothetical protein
VGCGRFTARAVLVTLAIVASIRADAAPSRGGIAFHYATPLSARELEFYSRFEVLVTHDPLPRAQIDALHAGGTRLALYEWAVAYYESLRTLWHDRQPRAAFLNQRPLRGYLGSADADAYYYDPAQPGHQRGRAEMLARRLRTLGYDGIFLDTTTSHSVHPEALAEYERRHPELPYDQAFAGFLRALRAEGVSVIITNQGYRAAEHVLPHVDWDVTESLITFPRGGRFVFRPWNDPDDPWNSTKYLMRNLIAPVREKYPGVRYAHINYVDAAEPSRVAEIVAITRLFDADAVVATAGVATTIASELLLLDLGAVRKAGPSYRVYERGFIAYNPSARPLRVRNRETYEDAVTGRRLSGTIVVPPRAARILRRVQ